MLLRAKFLRIKFTGTFPTHLHLPCMGRLASCRNEILELPGRISSSPWFCSVNKAIVSFCCISFRLRHPRRPRGGQSGREKRRDKSFQVQAEKPLGTDSHQTISKRSTECWLLIGRKKCFVLLCPIGEQQLLSSFREFIQDGYWLDHSLSGSCTKEMHAVRNISVWYKRYISKYW